MSIIRVARVDSMKWWISAAMRSDCCCWCCCDVTLAHHTLGRRTSIIYSRWTADEQATNTRVWNNDTICTHQRRCCILSNVFNSAGGFTDRGHSSFTWTLVLHRDIVVRPPVDQSLDGGTAPIWSKRRIVAGQATRWTACLTTRLRITRPRRSTTRIAVLPRN